MPMLALDRIRLDGKTQVRADVDMDAVSDYADAMLAGAKFPAADVFHDGSNHWLADGFTRYHARRKAGMKDLLVNIHTGTQDEARWFASGANRTNGQRLNRKDLGNAIRAALELRPNESDRAIAEHVGASHSTVARYRSEREPGGQCATSPRRAGQDGKSYPAKNPARPNVPKSNGKAPREPEPQARVNDEVVMDELGNVCTDHRDADVFLERPQIIEQQQNVQAIRRAIKELAGRAVGQKLDAERADGHLKEVWDILKLSLPHCLTPEHVAKHPKWNGRRWLTKEEYDALPKGVMR